MSEANLPEIYEIAHQLMIELRNGTSSSSHARILRRKLENFGAQVLTPPRRMKVVAMSWKRPEGHSMTSFGEEVAA
jgi:hypothetical protein